MSHILELYKNSDNLHHAYYFVEHKLEDAVHKLKEFLEKVAGVVIVGNPDFSHRKYETFTVENAKEISSKESRKRLGSDKKIFIIETDFITEEAQNALLKIFEEPTAGTHFFVLSPQDILLPTLRSRMQVFVSETKPSSVPSLILDMNLKERLEMVKEITEGIKDEEKTKQDAISFLNQIEKELYEDSVNKNFEKLKACEQTRESLYDRGAPVKIVLENLILSV